MASNIYNRPPVNPSFSSDFSLDEPPAVRPVSSLFQDLQTQNPNDFMSMGSNSSIRDPAMQFAGGSIIDSISGIGTGGAGTFKPSWSQRAFGYTDPTSGVKSGGWVSPTLGIAQGAMQTWLGLKQLGVAEDNLDFQKDAFSKQFNIQQSLTNTALEDKAKARYDRNPGLNPTVDEYMKKHSV